MPAVGDQITAASYNAIVNKINKVLGDDGVDPQVGYGRSISSSTVSAGDLIDDSLMTNLYNDLVRARTHQKGSAAWDTSADGLASPDEGEYIGAFAADIGTGGTSVDATNDTAEGFLDFEQAAQDILDDKDDAAAAEQGIKAQGTSTRTTAWNGTITHEFDLVFANANARRYFFNAGGLVFFDADLTGGNSVAGDQTQTYPDTPAYQKDEIWQTMLNNMATITFGKNATTTSGTGTAQAIGNYDLTTSYQTIFQKDGSGVYSENYYRIEARANATGNVLEFKITFVDADVGDDRGGAGSTPVDENVGGTINSNVQTRAATGLGIGHPTYTINTELEGSTPANTYVLTAPNTSITEGDSITITLTTTGLPNGTNVPYTITGVTSADINGASLTGNFTTSNNSASVTLVTVDDGVTEGTETLVLTLDNNQADISVDVGDTGTPTPTYSITNPSPNVIAEGSTGTFTVTTTNVPNGTVLYWTISHLTTEDADFSAVSGTVTINNNSGTIDITPTADVTTEGQESFILRLRTGSATGAIVASGGSGTTVGDTSTTPPPSISGISPVGDTYVYGFQGTDSARGAGTIIRFFGDGDIHKDSRGNDGIYNAQVQNTTAVGTWLPSGRTADEYEIKVTTSSPSGLSISNTTNGTFTAFSASATASQGVTFYLPSTEGQAEITVNLEITIREIANTAVSTTFTGSGFFSVEA